MTTTREALAALLKAWPIPCDHPECLRPGTHEDRVVGIDYKCAEHAPRGYIRVSHAAAIEQAERALDAEPVTVTLTERGYAELVITVDGRGPGATVYEASVSLLSPAKDAAAIVAELLGAKVVRR